MHTFQRIRRAGICLASAMVILCSTLMPASAAQEASKATEPTEATASAADTKTAAFDPMDEAYQVAHTNRKHTSVISAGLYHTCWLQDDGTVISFGNSDNKRLETTSWKDITAVSVCGQTLGLKKDGTVVFVSDMDGICAYMPQWTNVKELRYSGHGFYVIRNDGTVDAEIEDYFEGLTGAVMVTDWRDWIFGISPDGQLLTHNGGSIYPNTGCMMVDEPGLPYYGEEADIRRFNQVRDIIQSFGLVILNKDGTAEHIGDCPHWELSSWENIESIHALTNYDGDAYYLYGIQRNGSVVRNRYDWQQVEQTVEEQYRGWKLKELYPGKDGMVGLTLDGKLVGDGIYETVDFSVFDR